jgi:hypothetical protein
MKRFLTKILISCFKSSRLRRLFLFTSHLQIKPFLIPYSWIDFPLNGVAMSSIPVRKKEISEKKEAFIGFFLISLLRLLILFLIPGLVFIYISEQVFRRKLASKAYYYVAFISSFFLWFALIRKFK